MLVTACEQNNSVAALYRKNRWAVGIVLVIKCACACGIHVVVFCDVIAFKRCRLETEESAYFVAVKILLHASQSYLMNVVCLHLQILVSELSLVAYSCSYIYPTFTYRTFAGLRNDIIFILTPFVIYFMFLFLSY